MMIRPTAVAGRFYPGTSRALDQTLEELVRPTKPEPALAVIAPHAGYVYSGLTAGRVFAAVEVPDRVVVLCPNHTGRGEPLSVWPEGRWELPNTSVPVDGDLTTRILDAHRGFRSDTRAHTGEHAIEVELPFLHVRNPDVRIAAIVCAHLDRETALEVGRSLADVVRQCDGPVLLVASSDMSHYVPARVAARLDRLALDRVEALDPAGLYDVVKTNRISMCGVLPATIALAAAVELGAQSSRVIDYTHSGMVTGDDSAVVGYAGVVVR